MWPQEIVLEIARQSRRTQFGIPLSPEKKEAKRLRVRFQKAIVRFNEANTEYKRMSLLHDRNFVWYSYGMKYEHPRENGCRLVICFELVVTRASVRWSISYSAKEVQGTTRPTSMQEVIVRHTWTDYVRYNAGMEMTSDTWVPPEQEGQKQKQEQQPNTEQTEEEEDQQQLLQLALWAQRGRTVG